MNGLSSEISITDLFSVKKMEDTLSEIEKDIRTGTPGDIIFWSDLILFLRNSLGILRNQIIGGGYQPGSFTTFEVGKENGYFRTLVVLNLTDRLIYRLIVDEAYKLARPLRVKKAFYVNSKSKNSLGKISLNNKILVTADIANYFGSIDRNLLGDFLHKLGLSAKITELLDKLLNHFAASPELSLSVCKGLPVDGFECHGKLAHIFLFDHDRRMVKLTGEENYIRYLDDQYLITGSRTQGRRIIQQLTRSLSQKKLSLNSAKTILLKPARIGEYFALESHELLNAWETQYRVLNSNNRKPAEQDFIKIWKKIRNLNCPNRQNRDKVLIRIYKNTARLKLDLMEKYALGDLIESPRLDTVIFEYFSVRNRGRQLVDLFSRYCLSGENLFESTETVFFRSLFLLNIDLKLNRRLRKLAGKFILGTFKGQTGRNSAKAPAILLLYWLGEKFSEIYGLFDSVNLNSLSPLILRSWITCLSALKHDYHQELTKLNSKIQYPEINLLVKYLTDIKYGKITLRRNDFVRFNHPLDNAKMFTPESWLLWEITSLSSGKNYRLCHSESVNFKKSATGEAEKAIYARVSGNLGSSAQSSGK